MSTLQEMVEYCDCCSEELEIGQIGQCDDCQALNQPDEPSKVETDK